MGMDEVTESPGTSDTSSAWYVWSVVGEGFKKPPVLENLKWQIYVSQKYLPKIRKVIAFVIVSQDKSKEVNYFIDLCRTSQHKFPNGKKMKSGYDISIHKITGYRPWYWVEVNDQFHSPADLPLGKEPSMPIEQELV